MPELRENPLTGVLVIVAPGRATRPHTVARVAGGVADDRSACPFCPGNERDTPPEVARTGSGAPDTPGWRVRVAPNKYPIVGDGVPGAHEVVILSPAHDATFDRLAVDQAAEALIVMRDRVAHHRHAGLAHATAFLNHGKAAGASIEHPHGQIVGLGFVAPGVESVLARCRAAGRDVVGAIVAEARAHDLVVADGIAPIVCPRASVTPWEMLVAHDAAGPAFHTATDEALQEVALALQNALARLRAVLGDAAYNVIVQTAPTDRSEGFRWHVRITPRVAVTAGFEHVTDVYVNTVPPEDAAAALRHA